MAPEDLAQIAPPQVASPVEPVELKPIDDTTPIRVRPPRSPFLTTGNLMLVGAFVMGAALLYMLKCRIRPSSALAEQNLAHAKVEAALDVLAAKPTPAQIQRRSTAKAMVSEFYTAARQRQVDLRDLRGNPFVFRGIPKPKPVELVKPKPIVPKVPDDERQALEAAKTLRLKSIIAGEQTVAMISSNILSVGETIKGWTVIRIDPKEVELSWKDKRHVLEMPK